MAYLVTETIEEITIRRYTRTYLSETIPPVCGLPQPLPVAFTRPLMPITPSDSEIREMVKERQRAKTEFYRQQQQEWEMAHPEFSSQNKGKPVIKLFPFSDPCAVSEHEIREMVHQRTMENMLMPRLPFPLG